MIINDRDYVLILIKMISFEVVIFIIGTGLYLEPFK